MKFITQRTLFLAGLILLLSGLVIALTPTYMAKALGLVLMVFGFALLILTAQKKPEPKIITEKKEAVAETITVDRKTLAETLISVVTFKGRIKSFFLVLGILLILLVYAFNIFFREGFELGVNDTITILLGATMILYNYIPKKYDRERDFVLLFFIFLFVIIVLPTTIYSIVQGPIPESPNSPFIYWLLAQPTSDLLNFIRIPSEAYTSTSGVFIDYKILGDVQGQGTWGSVGIGLSCTGLYSVSIFISGFIAFILLEYRRFDIKVASLLTMGVFTSWFANILRMTIIVAVGSYYGGEALKWTHENLGIFIFMLWVGLFWALMFKLLVPKGDRQKKDEKTEEEEEIPEAGASKENSTPNDE
ncbi:MAG: exosortase/archaeosortase family protein [Methanomassiliicoccales archaeon]|nr:MAG: exosortase/archaeosortase family protein [Methanomassiliicoccales archaeon]